MPEIPEISVDVGAVQVPVIPAWRSMPPQSIPEAPPVTLRLGFPVADIPGCVETRNTQPGNKAAYENDPRGNFVVCDGTLPAFPSLSVTPGIAPPKGAGPPSIDVPKKTAGGRQPKDASPSISGGEPDILKVATELPCPPPDAIPLGAKNKSQTAVVVGYNLINGECQTQYEPLDVPTIIGNYLPGAPVVFTTSTIATVATTAAVCARPLGDFMLKVVKPTVKKVIKRIKERLGKKVVVESVYERRKFQRSLRK